MTNNYRDEGQSKALKKEFPEVIEYARAAHQSILVTNQLAWSCTDKQGNKKVFNLDNAYFVDPSFVMMLTFPFIYGDPRSALKNQNDIAISRTVAQKFFGDENPVGMEVRINDAWPLKITGVFEDVPENSSIKFDALVLLNMGSYNDSWIWPSYYTFIKLDSLADPRKLQAKMQDFADKYLGDIMKKYNWHNSFILQPITDIHLKSPELTEERAILGNIRTVYFLVVIAIFILVIALINYINLTTAKSIERSKEVGLRKAVGSSREQLIFQFLFESAIINLMAIFLSILLLMIFLPSFNHLTGNITETKGLIIKLISESAFWISLLIMFITGTFLAGIYPAFVLSGFKPVSILKGSHPISKAGILYRKILVGFQFFISLALITGTLIVYRQVVFMRNQALGFNKDQIIVIKSPAVIDSTINTKIEVFRNEIKRGPQIENFTTSSQIPGEWISNPWYAAKYYSVKCSPGNIHESVDLIRDQYNKIFPGNYFEYFFLDEYFDIQYSSYKQFGSVFATFTLIAIIVAYLGLLGLTTYLISRRTKEIAIRKVYGATIKEMVVLLAKDFVRLILIAGIIALPFMYFLGKYWLNNFAFKIHIGWMMLILPVLILLIITLVTTGIQTIKSSLINPADTLKYE